MKSSICFQSNFIRLQPGKKLLVMGYQAKKKVIYQKLGGLLINKIKIALPSTKYNLRKSFHQRKFASKRNILIFRETAQRIYRRIKKNY